MKKMLIAAICSLACLIVSSAHANCCHHHHHKHHRGITGPTGPTGATGATGPAGENGTFSDAFAYLFNNAAGDDITLPVAFNDASFFSNVAIATGEEGTVVTIEEPGIYSITVVYANTDTSGVEINLLLNGETAPGSYPFVEGSGVMTLLLPLTTGDQLSFTAENIEANSIFVSLFKVANPV